MLGLKVTVSTSRAGQTTSSAASTSWELMKAMPIPFCSILFSPGTWSPCEISWAA